MRIRMWIIPLWAAAFAAPAQAMSLQDAIRQAQSAHPALRAASLAVESARERWTEAQASAYNPELSIEPQRRRLAGGGRANDYYLTISQGIETAGKRTHRADAARALARSVEMEQANARLGVALDAARAFVRLAIARRIESLRERQLRMMRDLRNGMRNRLALGDAGLLDGNLVEAELRAAQQAALAARTDRLRAAADLAAALGGIAPPQRLRLPHLDPSWRPPATAVEQALRKRPDLAALRARRDAAAAKAELAAAARIPDVTLSLMTAREAGDRLLKIGVSLPLPLWNTHRGAWRAALTERERAETERTWAETRARQEIETALRQHEAAMHALAADKQPENDALALARTAFEEGEIGLERFVFHARSAMEANITHWRIVEQAWVARIALARALGQAGFITQGVKP